MWPVIDLISLIGWNYSIQTGENISTIKGTPIYIRSRSLYSKVSIKRTDCLST